MAGAKPARLFGSPSAVLTASGPSSCDVLTITCGGAEVAGLRVNQNGVLGVGITALAGCLVRDCEVWDSRSGGLSTYGDGIYVFQTTNVQIVACNVHNTARYGICVIFAYDTLVQGCQVTNCGAEGIFVGNSSQWSAGSAVSGCVVDGCCASAGSAAISLSGRSVSCVGCTALTVGGGRPGILVGGGSLGIVLSGNAASVSDLSTPGANTKLLGLCYRAHQATPMTGVTGDGAQVTVAMDSPTWSNGFGSGGTATVRGIYWVSATVQLNWIEGSPNEAVITLQSSGTLSGKSSADWNLAGANGGASVSVADQLALDAGDRVSVLVWVSGGYAQSVSVVSDNTVSAFGNEWTHISIMSLC